MVEYIMIDRDRGLKLLGSGLGPTDVATALGCDPSFVSQWLMDDAFRAQVLAQRMESLQAQTLRDRAIDGIEDELITKLRDSVQWLVKPKDILGAFAILNAAKRRGASTAGSINLTQNVVSLVLPPVARHKFLPTMNANNEVVAIGDQSTVTAPLQSLVQARLKERKNTAEPAQEIPNGRTEGSSERKGEVQAAG